MWCNPESHDKDRPKIRLLLHSNALTAQACSIPHLFRKGADYPVYDSLRTNLIGRRALHISGFPSLLAGTNVESFTALTASSSKPKPAFFNTSISTGRPRSSMVTRKRTVPCFSSLFANAG